MSLREWFRWKLHEFTCRAMERQLPPSWKVTRLPKCERHFPCERQPDDYCARCHSEMYP